MSWLLDVNMVLGSRWMTHPDHASAKSWLDSITDFRTCAIGELGFMRISLSPVYQATWNQVPETLAKLHGRPGHQFLADDVGGAASPETGPKDTTDAHLVALAWIFA